MTEKQLNLIFASLFHRIIATGFKPCGILAEDCNGDVAPFWPLISDEITTEQNAKREQRLMEFLNKRSNCKAYTRIH